MKESLHTVWEHGGILGIRCNACDHRAALSPEQLPIIRRNNTKPLAELTLRCRKCETVGRGSAFWEMCLPEDWEGARQFLSGYDDAHKCNLS